MFNAKLLTTFVLLAASGTVSAHPGHDISGFTTGILHPINGLDHLLAMLSVGLWVATLGGDAQWKIPGAFVTMLVVGAMLGMNGIHLPLVEPFIALSVLLLGLAVTLTLRVTAIASIAMVSLFALFHGHAHGSELIETASSFYYLLGLTLTSSALHLGGLIIGHSFKRHAWLLRSGGAVIASMGVWMAAGL